MKISLDWLSDYVTWIETDPHKIAERITASVGEIDEVEELGALMENCVVGKITSCEKHPNADKLSLCKVETDKGEKQVVCGGTNLAEGMHIAFAHVGATVKWGGKELATLEAVKIRGEKSEGMICAAEELDLDAIFPPAKEDGSRPIINLGEEYKVGMSLKEALGFNDTVLHIDNHAITQRPDLFSHIGVARECVALGIAKWKKEPNFAAPKFASEKMGFKTTNECPDIITHYRACTLSIENVGETPDWMKKRLEATGWRSINLPIDITNYVMMEVGMPLHSFDADDFAGDITMRQAKKGEKITTLDEEERELNEGAVVISDKEGIFDLLGIMGGLRSSTKPTTKNVYLHSARVDPVAIRNTILAIKHRTDAATVYEKGIAPITVEQGFHRALELFLELVPGAKITSAVESQGKEEKKKEITFDAERCKKLLGIDLSAKDMEKSLTALGCEMKKGNVTAPLWRTDLKEPADLIEEIGRLYGYDKIPSVMPDAAIRIPKRDTRLNTVRDALKERGMVENLHLAFTSPESIAKAQVDHGKQVVIENPLGEELSIMRPALMIRMLETASRELRTRDSVKTFEVGNVFTDEEESTMLTLLISKKRVRSIKEEPLLIAKQIIAEAMEGIGYPLETEEVKDAAAYIHPGKHAVLKTQGKKVGWVFNLHPAICKAFDLPEATAIVSIHWESVKELTPQPAVFKDLPAHPAISYDETFDLTQKKAGDLMAKAMKSNDLLESVETVDLHRDDERMNVTLRFTYRAADRTLTEEEVSPIHRNVVTSLA